MRSCEVEELTKLRITPDGRVCGLWSDDIPLGNLGPVRVRRASHVEFNNRLQRWTVRPAGSPDLIRRWLGRLLRHRASRIVHSARSRANALAWEHNNFQPGGPFWPALTDSFADRPDRSPFTF